MNLLNFAEDRLRKFFNFRLNGLRRLENDGRCKKLGHHLFLESLLVHYDTKFAPYYFPQKLKES